jgi:hypothetical protein
MRLTLPANVRLDNSLVLINDVESVGSQNREEKMETFTDERLSELLTKANNKSTAELERLVDQLERHGELAPASFQGKLLAGYRAILQERRQS